MFEFLTDECVSDHNERIRSIQIDKNRPTDDEVGRWLVGWWLVPHLPTDDEVVHLKRLGNKVLVDLYQSNPLIVIWDALVGQKFKHHKYSVRSRKGLYLVLQNDAVDDVCPQYLHCTDEDQQSETARLSTVVLQNVHLKGRLDLENISLRMLRRPLFKKSALAF